MAQIVESDSKPVIDYLSLALDIPKTDERFRECRFMGQYTVNGIDVNSEKLRYKLDPIRGPATYDLSDMYLMAKIRITDKSNKKLADDVEASTINNILLSAFKKMTIYVNDKVILDMSNFGFSQYFVNRLSSDITSSSTWMSAQGYFEDQLGKFDDCSTGSDPAQLGGNAGYLQRKMCFAKLTKKSVENTGIEKPPEVEDTLKNLNEFTSRKRKLSDCKEDESNSKRMKKNELDNTFVWTWTDEAIYFCAPISSPLGFTPLLPEATVKIDFDLQDPKFYFMSETTTDLKFSFEQAILKVPKYSLEPSLYSALLKKLEENPLKFFFNRNEILIETIPRGVTQEILQIPSFHHPSKIFCGVMESNRFLGDFKLNPYKFSTMWVHPVTDEQFELKDVELKLNNTENDGFKTQIDPVFRTQFLKLHKHLHGLSPVSCPNINYGNFKDNTALFVNDLTSSGGITPDWLNASLRTGPMQLVLTFSKPTVMDMHVLIFLESPSLVSLSKEGRVTVDN